MGDSSSIRYEFHVEGGREHTYDLDLTGPRKKEPAEGFPRWTRLDHHACDHCPLDPKTQAHCPAAVHLARFVEEFHGEISSTHAKVRVLTPDRNYEKTTSVQEGLHSLFGLIMATSDCPSMAFFKAMARYHLPFASTEETIVRAASLYLLGQFFESKKGKPADWDLSGLDKIYQKVQKVNGGMLQRIQSYLDEQKEHGDADQNAIVILNTFAQHLGLELEDNLENLTEIRDLLAAAQPS